jgi:hypothetical protein
VGSPATLDRLRTTRPTCEPADCVLCREIPDSTFVDIYHLGESIPDWWNKLVVVVRFRQEGHQVRGCPQCGALYLAKFTQECEGAHAVTGDMTVVRWSTDGALAFFEARDDMPDAEWSGAELPRLPR